MIESWAPLPLAVVMFLAGLMVGVLFMPDSETHTELIKRNLGRYHPKTGEFTFDMRDGS